MLNFSDQLLAHVLLEQLDVAAFVNVIRLLMKVNDFRKFSISLIVATWFQIETFESMI